MVGDGAAAGDTFDAGWNSGVVNGNRVLFQVDGGGAPEGLNAQLAEGTPRRMTWLYTDAAGADAVGTITIQGLNAFNDPITETIAFAPGTLTGDTVNAYRRVERVEVTGADAVIDILPAADSLRLSLTQHLVFGPCDPNVQVAAAARFGHILGVYQNIAAGGIVQMTFAAANGAPGANEYQVDAINANGECSLNLNGADDFDGAFYFDIMYRYRGGQAL